MVVGTTISYIGSTAIQQYLEWNDSTTSMRKFYYAGSTRMAMRTGSTLNYLMGDHLGSQAITTDSNGNKTGEIRYYPWGTERYFNSSIKTSIVPKDRLTMIGQMS